MLTRPILLTLVAPSEAAPFRGKLPTPLTLALANFYARTLALPTPDRLVDAVCGQLVGF